MIKEIFMSQAKVDRKKELKANRKQIVAKEKRRRVLSMICGWAILFSLIGWAGYSAYGIYQSKQPAIYADLTAINDYVSSLTVTK